MSSIPCSPPRPRPRPPQGLPFSFLFLFSIPRPLPGPLPLPLPLCPSGNYILTKMSKLSSPLKMFAIHLCLSHCCVYNLKSIRTLLLLHPPHVSSVHLVFSVPPPSLTRRIFWLLIFGHVVFIIILLVIVVVLVVAVVAVFVEIAALVRWGPVWVASLWMLVVKPEGVNYVRQCLHEYKHCVMPAVLNSPERTGHQTRD